MSHDAMLEPSAVAAFNELELECLLKMRFFGAILMEPDRDIEEQIEAVLKEKAKNQHAKFWTNTVKIFVDGVIEGGTAYLLTPYEHKPDYLGVQIWDPIKLNGVVSALDAEGMQIHFHVIGDGAARIAIDALEIAQVKNGKRDSRHLITHLQLVAPEDIPRFKNIGAIGVPQPFWFAKGEYYRELALPFLGKERADAQYPMKSFIEAGIPMASASDFPVTIPFDPLLGIQTGIIRYEINDGPDQVLWAEESVSLEEMIESFTLSGALANFTEDKTGSLEVGKQADLIILDRNLFSVPQDKIAGVKVLLTLVDGEIVYREKDFD
jgi:predicted amidohydrolase YtcJ